MIRRLSNALTEMLGYNPPGRKFPIYDDDVFVVSYPKSGNTWTRFLIANLLNPETDITFLNIGRLLPDPEWQSRRVLQQCPRPRVIKSHHPFDPRYKKVIFIVRDPRDIVLSQHHFQIKRGDIAAEVSIREFIPRFIAGETSDYGSWGQNVGSWLVTRHNTPGFLLLRYEDMLVDPISGLEQIGDFLGLSPSRQCLARAAELSSAEKMRKLEKEQARDWIVTKATRQDMPFIRAASAGGWKDNLSEESLALIEAAWGNLMLSLGYELEVLTPAQADRNSLAFVNSSSSLLKESAFRHCTPSR